MRTLQPLRGVPTSLIVYLLVLLAFAFFPLTAQAASIEVLADETSDHPALIFIKGRFLKCEAQNDVATFATLAGIQKNSAIVFLESQRGMIGTALQIGKIIQRYSFSTAVGDQTVCSSACALIWLAGKERFMAPTASIGFHASSTAENPGSEVSSYGNAMVGAYLYEIGLREPATIVYLTKASPQSMTWLTMSDAIRYRIAAKAFGLSQDKWSWAREALTGSSRRRQIDPPAPIPATRPGGASAERPLSLTSRTDTSVKTTTLPPTERERALGLHEKGIEELKRSLPRVIYSKAPSRLGWRRVPCDELAKLNNVGVVAEVDVARRWYEKARELGAGEAAERLRRLVAPNQRGHGYVAPSSKVACSGS